MTKVFNILLLSSLSILSIIGGISSAFAQLSFDQEYYIEEHNGYLIFKGATNPLSAEITTPSSTDTVTVNFDPVFGTTDLFKSENFTLSSGSGSGDKVLNVDTTTITSIEAETPAGDTTSAPVADNNELLLVNNSTQYRIAKNGFSTINYACEDNENIPPYYTNGDEICDEWETPQGLKINAGTGVTLSYPCDPNAGDPTHPNYDPTGAMVCPSTDMIDLYYEIDSMENHSPDIFALEKIVQKFKEHNINLHLFVDDKNLPHVNELTYPGSHFRNNAGYDQLKFFWYGNETEHNGPDPLTNGPMPDEERDVKNLVFHYMIMGHERRGSLGTSGVAEIPGNDALITLGGWPGSVGTEDQQAATIMHEIGHNLNLDHGGDEGKNCKPNYISIMSYSRQFDDYVVRELDYSNKTLSNLMEDPAGLQNIGEYPTPSLGPLYSMAMIIFGDESGNPVQSWANGDDTDYGDPHDLNFLNVFPGCESDSDPPFSSDTLESYNDWENIDFISYGDNNWLDGGALLTQYSCKGKNIPGTNPVFDRVCILEDLTWDIVDKVSRAPEWVDIPKNHP